MQDFEKVISEVIQELKTKKVLDDTQYAAKLKKSKKDIDEYSYLQMLQTLFEVLLQYFDSQEGNRKQNRLNSSKYAILFLLPAVEDRVLHCTIDYQPKYYALYEKVFAFTGRCSLEHFIDYMQMQSGRRVLDGRRSILKPLLFYLNKITFDERLKYIIASYPPSAGKSFTLTYFTAWLYGVDRNSSIIRMSYSDDLVAGFSRSVRDIIQDPRYSDVFPEYVQYGGNPFATKDVYNWKLKDSQDVYSHMAMSRDGQVTGKRASTAIIFDDMTKGAEEATDSALHKKYYDKWKTEWYNRKNGDDTNFIFAGTMWSPEDILNRVREDREHLSPLKPDKNFKYTDITEDGSTVVIRVPLLDLDTDETTCKAIMSTKEARNLRDTTDEFLWYCVYQQRPIPATGLTFAYDGLRHYDIEPVNEQTGESLLSKYSFAVLDTTRKGKDNASMPIFKTDGISYYMIDCIFQKKAMTDLYEDIIAKIEEHNITQLCVENNTDTSLKTLLEEMLAKKGIYTCVITEKYQGNKKKELRIKDAQGLIRKLCVFKEKKDYTNASDYGRFMQNFTTYSFDYPNRNDDAPDSLALFVNEIILQKSKPSKPEPISRYSLGF